MTNPMSAMGETAGNLAHRYLHFSLGKEDYAIPLLAVREVIAVPEITKIPNTPPHFLGIMNLRGRIISVIDLRLKLGIKPTENKDACVIICDFGSLVIGVVIDSVNSVLTLQAGDISPKPQIESSKKTDYILGVTKRDEKLILLCDIAKTLDLQDHQMAQSAAGSR